MRNPDLEKQIIAQKADDDSLLVYGDWLQQRGDPRGELIAVQAARKQRPHDESLAAQERDLLAAQQSDLLGELADLAAEENNAFAIGWRLGFIDKVHVQIDELPETWPLQRVLRSLETLPSAFAFRHLKLEIHFPGGDAFTTHLNEVPRSLTTPLQQVNLVAPDYLATDPVGSLDHALRTFPVARNFALAGTWTLSEPKRDIDRLAVFSPTLSAKPLQWAAHGKVGRLKELCLFRTNVNPRLEEERTALIELFRSIAYSDPGSLEGIGLGLASNDDMHDVLDVLLPSPLLPRVHKWFVPIRYLNEAERARLVESSERLDGVALADLAASSGAWEHWQITSLLRKMNRTAEALSFAVDARQTHDDHHHLSSEIGHLLRDMDRHEEAVEAYEHALTIDEECWACYYNQAWSLRDLRRFAEALVKVEKAVEHRTSEDPAPLMWLLRGHLLLAVGRDAEGGAEVQKTIAHYSRELRRSRREVNARYWRAAAYAILGNQRRALREVKKVLRNGESMRSFDWDWVFEDVLGEDFTALIGTS